MLNQHLNGFSHSNLYMSNPWHLQLNTCLFWTYWLTEEWSKHIIQKNNFTFAVPITAGGSLEKNLKSHQRSDAFQISAQKDLRGWSNYTDCFIQPWDKFYIFWGSENDGRRWPITRANFIFIHKVQKVDDCATPSDHLVGHMVGWGFFPCCHSRQKKEVTVPPRLFWMVFDLWEVHCPLQIPLQFPWVFWLYAYCQNIVEL